ncbi:MAG: response regulator [Elusimicrobiota bacterium]
MSKILIVDDDKNIHMTIAGILRKEGHEVDFMDNGYKAIEAAEENSYDIALMDIRMPGINGVETFKKFKKISPETTVIMMTAYAVEDLKEEAEKEGAYKIIDKPFDMQGVLNMLDEIGEKNMVMIVDDNTNFRMTLKKSLQGQGFKPVSVENGNKALEVIERKIPDVIILDCKMPGLSGPDTLSKLNKMTEKLNKKPEVILVSGYNDEEEIEKGLSLGAKKFLQKPVDVKALKESIENLISKGAKAEGKDKKPSILVVDDETYFRQMLSEILKDSGYEVEEAENGSMALEKISRGDCNAVLLDIRLPDLSGIEVYEKIKEECPDMKVIMMTAYAKDNMLMDKIKKGGYTCLIKPFKISRLLQMINNIAEGKKEKDENDEGEK